MATSSDTLTAIGASLTLNPSASGRADNLATFAITGTWAGLILQCWGSNDGTHYSLLGAYNDASKVWETQTLTTGFSVADSLDGTGSASWQVPCANRSAVKFVVLSVSGTPSIAIRADSSFQFGMSPDGPQTVYDPVTGTSSPVGAATADGVAAGTVPLAAIGLLDQSGTVVERLQGDGGGAALVSDVGEGADFTRLLYLTNWRLLKLIEGALGANLDQHYPPNWPG